MTTRSSIIAIHTIGSIGEWSGGPARTVTSLCTSVAKTGCRVDLVAGHNAERDAALVLPASDLVHVHLPKAKRVAGIYLYPGFSRTIESLAKEFLSAGTPVLIHDNGIWSLTNIASAKVARRLNVPYVLHLHGMMEPWAHRYKRKKKQLAWLLYQKQIISSCAVLVATSEQERDSIKQLFPFLPVAVIPNGVSIPVDIPNRGVRSEAGRANLLFMSRVHPKKNLFGLVQAWQEVCRNPSMEHWGLQIAGPDEHDHGREIKAMVHSLGLDSRVEFLGQIAEGEKSRVFESADLFVLPSFSENFGVVVAEALAHGLPVVATRGTPWKALIDQRCGWWVDTSPSALAQALAEAFELSPSERHAMGLRGREFARTAFSWDGIGLATVQLYEWVLRRNPSVPPFVYV